MMLLRLRSSLNNSFRFQNTPSISVNNRKSKYSLTLLTKKVINVVEKKSVSLVEKEIKINLFPVVVPGATFWY